MTGTIECMFEPAIATVGATYGSPSVVEVRARNGLFRYRTQIVDLVALVIDDDCHHHQLLSRNSQVGVEAKIRLDSRAV
jgi:hypothetical protein